MARKTHTSTEVKRRYNDRVYSQIAVRVPKDLAGKFREKSAELDIPQRQVIIDAITKFVEDDEK